MANAPGISGPYPACQPAYVTARAESERPWKLEFGLAISNLPVYTLAIDIAASFESLPEIRKVHFDRLGGNNSPNRVASSISWVLKCMLLAWIRLRQLSSIALVIFGWLWPSAEHIC